jgi:adenosine deaminase/adenosine deaminase CECR1
MKKKIIILITAIAVLSGFSFLFKTDTEETSALYNQFIENDNQAQLDLFCSLMPKGGDLHHHYSGSIYVETYLDWLSSSNRTINTKTLKVWNSKTDNKKNSISISDLRANDNMYRKLLSLWSDKDYTNHSHQQLAPDAAFFSTFGYFGSLATCKNRDLQILKERAIKENVSYIETMLKSVNYKYHIPETEKKNLMNEKLRTSLLFDSIYNKIIQDENFQKTVKTFVDNVRNQHIKNDYHMGIDEEDIFTMRYQTYVSRNSDPMNTFSGLCAAFEASKKSNLIVGVNIVGPENGITAIKDYNLHMQMFKYLSIKYPDVKKSMHAGELTLGMVRPKNLTFHITEAINTAKTDRVGHAVDIAYEQNAITVLDSMKSKGIPVEINLTSNDFILGVKNNQHPYMIYSRYNVPMVICTDDSGVSRNSLSGEFALLAKRYHPKYKTMKKYAYNSIRYSFLTDIEKEQMHNNLDIRFKAFEKIMANYTEGINHNN